MTMTITGQVVDHEATQSLSSLHVEAWNAYLSMNKPVADAFTDELGTFQIHLDEAYLQELFPDKQPKLYFKVFHEDELITSTEYTQIWRMEDGEREIVIEVDIPSLEESVKQWVMGQILNQGTGTPLEDCTVYALDLDAAIVPKDLGYGITDHLGRFEIAYTTPRTSSEEEGNAKRRLRLHILDPQYNEVYQSEVSVEPGSDQEIVVEIPLSALEKSSEIPLADLSEFLNLNLPPEFLPRLAEEGISTLADIRRVGSLSQFEYLPLSLDDPAIRTLEAQAALGIVSPDIRVNSLLIEKGYTSSAAIADSLRTDFVAAVHEELGDFKAAQLHATAQAQMDFLNNILTSQRADMANGFSSPFGEQLSAVDPVTCDCQDCDDALSPLAYLADLLEYAREHVKQIKAPPSPQGASQQDSGSRESTLDSKLPPPIIDPDGGAFIDSVTVFIDYPFDYPYGEYPVRIFYTLDGSAPSTNRRSPPLPNPFQITQSAMVRAVALIVSPKGVLVSKEADSTFTFLATTFCQPFGDLPASCDAADEAVRQVRICIEVLRCYLDSIWAKIPQNQKEALAQAEAAYRLATYKRLLVGIGTFYDEIRLARTAQEQDRQKLAERLGIDLGTAPRPDHLDALLLDPATLTEQSLEVLFGLVDTTRDPLSDGAKLGDRQGQITRWNLSGVELGRNTGFDGIIYLSLQKLPALAYRVELYADQPRTALLAAGELATNIGTVDVSAMNGSGLSGRFEIVYTADSSDIALSFVPALLSWRLRHLRTLWREEDWPIDAYTDGVLHVLPVIDPDVIGPDDLRTPYAKAQPGDPDMAFDIWMKRRAWVDERLIAMSSLTKKVDGQTVPDLAAMLEAMSQPISYGGINVTPWDNKAPDTFDSLLDDVVQGTKADMTRAAIQTIQQKLELTVESFLRLMAIRAKDQEAGSFQGAEQVTDTEWQEVYSILVQAQKVTLFSTWHDEEMAPPQGIVLGPLEFWPSLREPMVGAWPPVPAPPEERPLIDPEVVKLNDLPEQTAGRRAIALWQARLARLDAIRNKLKTARLRGFDAMIQLALGEPDNPADPLLKEVVTLYNNLLNNVDVENTKKKIQADLYMTVDDFLLLMTIRDKANSPKEPTVAEWARAYAILTSAQKEKREYPNWILEEERGKATGLVYWNAHKVRLPLWRSAVEGRQEWRQALRVRSQAPLIDPDLIGQKNIKAPALFDLWLARNIWVQKHLAFLQQQQQQEAADPLSGFDTNLIMSFFDSLEAIKAQLKSAREAKALDYILKEVLGDPLPDLDALLADLKSPDPVVAEHARKTITGVLYLTVAGFQQLVDVRVKVKAGEAVTDAEWDSVYIILAQSMLVASVMSLASEQKQGIDITARLAQFNLTNDAFAYMQRVRELLVEQTPVLNTEDEDWGNVFSIFVQANKRRLFAHWRSEENLRQITLGPDYFQNGIESAGTLIESPSLPAWRATLEELGTWLDILQSRIDQQQDTIDALQEVVDATEENSLPALRDALILATDAPGDQLDTKALWITSNLLIDTQTGPCQKITRVNQAIETLQELLFSLRNGEFNRHILDSVELTLDADNFDLEWVWLGSYANWSAARRVFLYPENTLQPTLRNWQSAGLENLVKDIRSAQQITPKQAREAARVYQDYFRDVCSLVVDATCYATTLIPSTQGYLFYMFAHSSLTNNLYWSAWDSQDISGYAQTPWQPLPGLDQTFKIIGATPFNYYSTWPKTTPTHRFVYLFASSFNNGQPVFVYTRYNLDSGNWDNQLTPLELPPDNTITASAEMVITQDMLEGSSPELIFWTGKGASLYSLKFNYDGTVANQWKIEDASQHQPFQLAHLCASTRASTINGIPSYIVASDTSGVLYSWLRADVSSWNKLVSGRFVAAFLWSGSTDTYVFFSSADSSVSYWDISSQPVPFLPLPNLGQLAFSTGYIPSREARQFVGTMMGTDPGLFRFTFGQAADKSLRVDNLARIAPYTSEPFEITELLSSQQLQKRRILEQDMFGAHAGASESVLGYLREAHYFVPVYLAQQLQQSGQYTSGLDWFRVVYDYSQPFALRKIYYGLALEESIPTTYQRGIDWLSDPLNPHTIAASRANSYTRFTLLSLVRCLLDFADAEFSRYTVESIPRARVLYMLALELLDLPDLKQNPAGCKQLISSLDGVVNDPYVLPRVHQIQRELARINDLALLKALIEEVKRELAENGAPEKLFKNVREVISLAENGQSKPLKFAEVLQGKRQKQSQAHALLLKQPFVTEAVARVGAVAAEDFLLSVSLISGINPARLRRERVEMPWLREISSAAAASGRQARQKLAMSSLSVATDLLERSPSDSAPTIASDKITDEFVFQRPIDALQMARKIDQSYIPSPNYAFCIPPNPVLKAVHDHAELNLRKLRNCLNIAGLQQQLELSTIPVTIKNGISTVQVIQQQGIMPQPTPYRYSTLIERAKQLVQLAGQVEAAMLSALEKRDAEAYNLLKARQDVGLARAGVSLQQLKLNEANDGVLMAQSQRGRAQIQVDHYQSLLDIGLIELERMSLTSQWVEFGLQAAAFTFAQSAAIAASFSPVSWAQFGSNIGAEQAAALQAAAGAAGTLSSIWATQASYERRAQEWDYQKNLAAQDVQIGEQQIKSATDHVQVTEQESNIAQMQADHAEAIVNFLANKFTNVELYDWMSGILEQVYRFFLQQATSMAQLGSNQLAFERHEVVPPFIQSDYWEAPSGSNTSNTSNISASDRRGLTGSARLLQDIYQLDLYAFETNKRKLQLSKTISLAQLAPLEFQRFRETGLLIFNTPMKLFDLDFPGHYLRLITRVRTSAIALIPPTQGIHATLSTNGLSRVVIGGITFQSIVVRRDPEEVALSSPFNATGVFELNPQPDMLLPFEGTGIDTTWEFRMPKATNQFDYSTIADVQLTIEYTALDSSDYRLQVIRRLNRTISADRPFSFRQQFADQWYDLHNPEQVSDPRIPMTIQFDTRREDFPPNIEDLKIQQLVLYFSRANGKSFEMTVNHLRFTEQGGIGSIEGAATSIDGVISTRRGNAASWTLMLGKAPIGTWELAFPDTQELRDRFSNEDIEDILFVITYSGRTPNWI